MPPLTPESTECGQGAPFPRNPRHVVHPKVGPEGHHKPTSFVGTPHLGQSTFQHILYRICAHAMDICVVPRGIYHGYRPDRSSMYREKICQNEQQTPIEFRGEPLVHHSRGGLPAPTILAVALKEKVFPILLSLQLHRTQFIHQVRWQKVLHQTAACGLILLGCSRGWFRQRMPRHRVFHCDVWRQTTNAKRKKCVLC